MIPAIIASIAGMLAKQGLGLLSDAVNGAGEKAVEFIEEKTGIKLTADGGQKVAALSPEQVLAMESLQSNERITLARLALENKVEDNRHEEAVQGLELRDTTDARETYEATDHSLHDELATKVFRQTAWIIPALIVGNILLMLIAAANKIDPVIAAGIGNIVGGSIMRFGDERKTILEFCFGGSLGRISRRESGETKK